MALLKITTRLDSLAIGHMKQHPAPAGWFRTLDQIDIDDRRAVHTHEQGSVEGLLELG